VIEDAACALGAEYASRPCGTLAEMGCFSFHPRKLITTGEGGAIATGDAALAQHLQSLRNHGQGSGGPRERFQMAGFNYRMTDFQAALGLAQLDRLPAIIERRRHLAALYDARLAALPGVRRPAVAAKARPVWQAYVVLVARGRDRDAIQQRLWADGIETTLGTYAVSTQPHYAGRQPPLEGASEAFERSLCLPLHTGLSDDDVDRVVTALADALDSGA
jgi:dTDP-4-amino-4,6-dideoxygalactose transaminase